MDASTVDRERLAGLHRLVAHVHHRGVPQMAVPLAASDGNTFFETQGCFWQLEPWMPGSADFIARPSEQRLRAALACLARWHVAAASFVVRPHESPWFFVSPRARSPGLKERAFQIERWRSAECALLRARLPALAWQEFEQPALAVLDAFPRVAPRVAASLKIGIEADVPLQPCLRDIWHDHVLFTGEAVTGLIDPHAARTDSVAADLARLLDTLAGDDRNQWDAGLASYQEVRRLSAAELALIELFDQSGLLLSGMNWLDWHLVNKRTFANRDGVLARLTSIAARLQRLADQA